jgi:general secretion pathway protein C
MSKTVCVNIGLALLVCFLAARLGAGIISYRLSHLFPKAGNSSSPPASKIQGNDLSSFAPILEKGLFGKAAKGTLSPVTVPSARNQGSSPGDLVLVGTAAGSFRETFALLRKTGTHEEKVFRLGDVVFGAGPLVSVRKESVEILSGGRRIRIFTPEAPQKEQAAPQPPPGTALASQSTAPGSFVIDQRSLNSALENMGQVMTDARLLPSMKEGKVEGFKASEVKPAGIFGILGIKNGDVLMRINDLNIDSPERAIQSLASLKGQNRIRLDLMRDGQPATLNYDIR